MAHLEISGRGSRCSSHVRWTTNLPYPLLWPSWWRNQDSLKLCMIWILVTTWIELYMDFTPPPASFVPAMALNKRSVFSRGPSWIVRVHHPNRGSDLQSLDLMVKLFVGGVACHKNRKGNIYGRIWLFLLQIDMAGPAKRRLHLQMDGESIVIDHSKHTRLVRFSSFFLYVNLAGSIQSQPLIQMWYTKPFRYMPRRGGF